MANNKLKRLGVEGNMMAQPRMFAHDAVTIPVIGSVTSVLLLGGGSGYPVGASNQTVTGGTGAALDVDIIVDAGGTVTSAEVNTAGTNYVLTDEALVLTINGGGGDAQVTISLAIPGTDQRGCCLYIGVAMNITVVMESGNEVEFSGVSAGMFMPIEVTHVTAQSAGDEDDILALY